MIATPDYAVFSSNVRLSLITGRGSIVLASIGPNEVIPRTPVELERGAAEVVMEADGLRYTWPVELPNGAVPFDQAIATRSVGAMRKSVATVEPS